jgi:ribosome-associated heat shock protein Hsp15
MASEADEEKTGRPTAARSSAAAGSGRASKAGGADGSSTDPKAAGAEQAAVDPKVAAAIAAAEAAGPADGVSVRVDSWIWAVRLAKTRSLGASACKGGHVKVNGQNVKPSHTLRVSDEVRVRQEGWERVVIVKRLIRKRVGAPVAAQCYVDNSPPPPPRQFIGAPAGIRDRGTGRPTKRDRREMERLRGLMDSATAARTTRSEGDGPREQGPQER